MHQNEFNKIFWGFLFIMISFRIQGIDILPDIIGYIFFAVAFSSLASGNEHFRKAQNFNIPMIILSVFSIYEVPAQNGGTLLTSLGFIGILISVVSIIFNLLVIYNMFMGIKDMAGERNQMELYNETDRRWNQYLAFQIAACCTFFLFFIPLLALVYVIGLLIVSIILTVIIMGFIKRCSISL